MPLDSPHIAADSFLLCVLLGITIAAALSIVSPDEFQYFSPETLVELVVYLVHKHAKDQSGGVLIHEAVGPPTGAPKLQ